MGGRYERAREGKRLRRNSRSKGTRSTPERRKTRLRKERHENDEKACQRIRVASSSRTERKGTARGRASRRGALGRGRSLMRVPKRDGGETRSQTALSWRRSNASKTEDEMRKRKLRRKTKPGGEKEAIETPTARGKGVPTTRPNGKKPRETNKTKEERR